jgi:RNA polymerase sigma factor (sigma-70 family)
MTTMRILCSTVLLLGLAAPQAAAWLPAGSVSIGWQSRSVCTTQLFTATSTSKAPVQSQRRISQQDNILEDGAGHVNRDLAERIWTWEQERRKSKNLPKVQYSVRAAMRLVDSLVDEALSKTQRRTSSHRKNGASGNDNAENELYADLIQEGLFALLDTMSQYRDDAGTAADFEATAHRQIRHRLALSLEEDAKRPVRLPKAVKAVVKEAKSLMKSMAVSAAGREPTLSQVAEKMDMSVARLQDYLRLARAGTLSMESTVEITNPAEDSSPAFADQDEWELRQGMLLDNGKTVRRDELVEEFLDEMLELEGDDEAWVHQERSAGPLQAMIPDTQEPSPDDLALSEMIRHDMSEFLSKSLDAQEVQVVRLSFGLDSGKSLSSSQIAKTMSISKDHASNLLKGGLKKLQASYLTRYVESYLEDDEEPYDLIDSV